MIENDTLLHQVKTQSILTLQALLALKQAGIDWTDEEERMVHRIRNEITSWENDRQSLLSRQQYLASPIGAARRFSVPPAEG